MSNSGGIITKPVRLLADIKPVLNENSNELSVLCKSSKINILSISKPTNKKGYVVSNPSTGDQGADGWFDATSCYSVKKPNIALNVNQWGGTLGGQGRLINANFKEIIASDILFSNNNYTHFPYNWEHDKPTYYRMLDFNNYSHIPKVYPATSSASPIITTNVSLMQYGTSALDAALTIRYSKNDVLEGNSECGKLGMDKLFNTQLIDNKWHLGICVYAPTKNQFSGFPTNRKVPVALVAIGSSVLGELDPITGSTNMMAVNTNTVSCISGSQASPSTAGFYIGEKVIIVPFLARLKNSNYYICIGLNNTYALNYSIKRVGENTPVVGNRASITSVTVTVTRLDNSDGTYTFYIANANDLSIQCSTAGEYVTMTYPLNITPADSSTNVNKLVDGKFSGASDPEVSDGTKVMIGTSRKLDATSISNWSNTTIPANRPPSVVLRKTTNTFNIQVGFSYWYNSMIRFNAVIPINTTISTTRYTVTLNK